MPPNKRKGNKMGDPEYRKGITRFRQALATEETFYRGLIGRIVGFYQLQPFTESHLFHLGIPVPGHVDGWGGDQGLAPVGKEEAREKVALVYKALICIGDLQRYREQYGGPKMDKVRSKTGEEVYGKAIDYYETARGLLPDDGTFQTTHTVNHRYRIQPARCYINVYVGRLSNGLLLLSRSGCPISIQEWRGDHG